MNANSHCKWYVFYTYPKFEKKVHEYLLKGNYNSFLPMQWVVRQWSDRKKRLYVPLFPNYIFVNIERNRIYEILKAPKIINCVNFSKNPAFIRQSEVDGIKKIVNATYEFEVCTNFRIGDSVVIKNGALTGLEGILIEERGSHRFALRIESLQQSVMVSVPSEHIEIAEQVV